MALTARLAHTDVELLKVIGYLPWCRLYEDGKDITETLTSMQMIDRQSQTVRYSSRAGRSSRRG